MQQTNAQEKFDERANLFFFFDVLVAVAVVVTKVPAKHLPTGDQNVYNDIYLL